MQNGLREEDLHLHYATSHFIDVRLVGILEGMGMRLALGLPVLLPLPWAPVLEAPVEVFLAAAPPPDGGASVVCWVFPETGVGARL